MAENVAESALVVIKSVLFCIILCTNIDNDITGFENVWVPAAFQMGTPISVCLA
jgi:hypothetical protein